MKSHAYVERIEDGIAVLELRLITTDYVPTRDEEPRIRFRYPKKILEIPVEELTSALPDVKERDVIVVEHADGVIQSICYIDYEEKQRRLERARVRHERLKSKMQKC